ARDAIPPAEPSLPRSLPSLQRPVIEVQAGSGAREIQKAINSAARQSGMRPSVHIPWSTYSIAQTLTITPRHIQLTGDVYTTLRRWNGSGEGPVIRLMGPTKATLREIQFDGAGKADGIVIDDVDQAGSSVYMGQAELRAGKRTNLFVNGLDRTNVQLEDLGYAYSPDAVSIRVTGGPLSTGGNTTAGQTNNLSRADP